MEEKVPRLINKSQNGEGLRESGRRQQISKLWAQYEETDVDT
jgi:hypothetical protein